MSRGRLSVRDGVLTLPPPLRGRGSDTSPGTPPGPDPETTDPVMNTSVNTFIKK